MALSNDVPLAWPQRHKNLEHKMLINVAKPQI